MRASMSYFHEMIWNWLRKFLRRMDTALTSIGVNEQLPLNVSLIQFSSWMGGDHDGNNQTPRTQAILPQILLSSFRSIADEFLRI